MAGVRIVTDSSCDLPAAIVEELGITVVPLSIRFGEEEGLVVIGNSRRRNLYTLHFSASDPSAGPSFDQFTKFALAHPVLNFSVGPAARVCASSDCIVSTNGRSFRSAERSWSIVSAVTTGVSTSEGAFFGNLNGSRWW